MKIIEDVSNAIVDDKKLTTIQKHGQLIVIILLSIALVYVCIDYKSYIREIDAGRMQMHKDDQEAIKLYRDSKTQTDKVDEQTKKINELLKALNDTNNGRR